MEVLLRLELVLLAAPEGTTTATPLLLLPLVVVIGLPPLRPDAIMVVAVANAPAASPCTMTSTEEDVDSLEALQSAIVSDPSASSKLSGATAAVVASRGGSSAPPAPASALGAFLLLLLLLLLW